MHSIDTIFICCPYCGENIELLVDLSIDEQDYIEDCEVCCRPITLTIKLDEDKKISVIPQHENDC